MSKSRIEFAQPGMQTAFPSDPTDPSSTLTNKQVTIDLFFLEEALGIPCSEQCGWPRFKFEDSIGPEGRYQLKRKLGWGLGSSVWLALDKK
jgi:serine/threonine-protein kinase SRPK3